MFKNYKTSCTKVHFSFFKNQTFENLISQFPNSQCIFCKCDADCCNPLYIGCQNCLYYIDFYEETGHIYSLSYMKKIIKLDKKLNKLIMIPSSKWFLTKNYDIQNIDLQTILNDIRVASTLANISRNHILT